MRVISGHFRSRKLYEVDSDTTRETKDRVKESIFNSIQPYLYDATVLDLFAGSGSLAIEALSRGATHATLVDSNFLAIQTCNKNGALLDILDRTAIHQLDATSFLQNTTDTFDIILLDPPYSEQKIDEIVAIIATNKLLRDSGIIVCLYGKNDSLLPENHGIIVYKTKRIGITNVTYMKWGD